MANPFDQFDQPASAGNPFDQFDTRAQARPQQPPEDLSLFKELDSAFLKIPGAPALAEFASAANRSIFDMVDFLGPDTINAVLELAGSQKRVPTASESLSSDGGYMEEGLARDAVQAAGQTAPMAVAVGQLLRTAAGKLPAIAPGESAANGVVRQLGAGTAKQDAVSGALAGAGGVAGKEVGGEPGELLGSLAGSMAGGVLAPVRAIANQADASKALAKAAPTVGALKGEARKIYKQLDDLGATVSPEHIGGLSQNIQQAIRREGFNARIHPKVNAALDEVASVADRALTVTELDTLRRVAGSAARSLEPDEARLGRLMVEKIDDFLTTLPDDAVANAKDSNVGAMFKEARGLWARARKSELLEQAVEKARNQASGFENGIRTQFRALLNNKKAMQGFSEEEKTALKRVVRGGPVENVLRALGKFGFTEGQASSMLLGSLGSAGGFAVGGAAGGVAVPLTGQLARNLAQRLTRNNAALADQLVRAGTNGREIARLYVKSVPAAQRSTEELAGLLLQQGADLNAVKGVPSKIVSEAAFLASLLGKAEPIKDSMNDELKDNEEGNNR